MKKYSISCPNCLNKLTYKFNASTKELCRDADNLILEKIADGKWVDCCLNCKKNVEVKLSVQILMELAEMKADKSCLNDKHDGNFIDAKER